MIRGVAGSILNMLHLARCRAMMCIFLLSVAAIAAYFISGNEHFRFVAQWFVLVLMPFVAVWTARISYSTKWNTFERSWPVSRTLMIVSRYIALLVMILGLTGLWFISPLFDGSYTNLAHTSASAFLTLAIYYPILHLVRGERGDLDTFIFIAASFGSIYALGMLMPRFGTGFGLVLVGAVYLVSLGLSVGFSALHRGRASC